MNKLRSIIQTLKEQLRALLQKGAFHVIAGSFLTKFVSFFGSIFLVRLLSKSDYGILSYYENLLGYFAIFIGLGLANGIQRYVILEDDLQGKHSCYTYALQRGTIYNIGIVLIGFVLCVFYPHPEAFRDYRLLMIVLALGIPFQYCQEAGLAAFRALFDYKRYAVISLCATAAIILGRMLGAYVGGLTGTVSSRIALEIACGVTCALLVRRWGFQNTKACALPPQKKKAINQYSWQMMLTNGLWSVITLNNLFLLGRLCANQEVIADYKVACFIPENLAILVSAIGVFIAPYFTKHEKEQNYEWIWKNYRTVLLVSMALMGGAALVCAVFSRFFITLLYGAEYLSAVPVMNVLLLSSFFNNGIRAATANALSAMGQQKYNLSIAAACMLLQVVANTICIPRYGALGVAWVSVFIYAIMAIFLFIVFYQKYYHKYKLQQL